MSDLERPAEERPWGTGEGEGEDLERASENVLEGWPATSVDEPPAEVDEPDSFESVAGPEPVESPVVDEAVAPELVEPELEIAEEPRPRAGAVGARRDELRARPG